MNLWAVSIPLRKHVRPFRLLLLYLLLSFWASVLPKDGKRWDAEEDHSTIGVKELGKSKWSDDLDEDDKEGSKGMKRNLNALSGIIQAYGKQGKTVRWSDQVTIKFMALFSSVNAMPFLFYGPY